MIAARGDENASCGRTRLATFGERAAAAGREQHAALAVQGFDAETSLAGVVDAGEQSELTVTSVVDVCARPNEHLALGTLPVAMTFGCGLVAWWATGYAVAAALVAVGMVSVVAGVLDGRSQRIPNRVVIVALAAFAIGALVTAIGDDRHASDVAGGAVLGLLVSGAPLLAVLWVIRPAAIGGGDVKLLAVQGATIGLLAPLAAPLVLLGGTLGGLGQTVALRRRGNKPLGPGLAVGFIVAVIVGATANVLFGGSYR